MAHNLSQHRDASGALRHSCFSLRINPWHQLGTVVEEPVASDQAQHLAGLAWSTKRLPMYSSEMDAVPEHFAVKRSDNQAILGVVGSKYVPLQNDDLFAFLRSLADVGEDVVVETAGALGRGETVWTLLRLTDRTIRIGEDESQAYLLASNGHVGNRLLTIQPVLVRVCCRNTLSAALAVRHGRNGTREGGFRIRHTAGMTAALGDVVAAYRGSVAAISELELAYSVLARTPLTEAMIRDTIDRAFRGDGEGAPSEADRAQAMRAAREDRIRAILASPTCQVPGTAGSSFALLQAIIEEVDHSRPTRTVAGQDTAAQRFASANWGSGARVKAQAFDLVLKASGAVAG